MFIMFSNMHHVWCTGETVNSKCNEMVGPARRNTLQSGLTNHSSLHNGTVFGIISYTIQFVRITKIF